MIRLPKATAQNGHRIDNPRAIAKHHRVDPHDRYVEARRLLDDGVVASKAELAGLLSVTRARITMLMKLDRLGQDVWDWLLDSPHRAIVSENLLREIAAKPQAHQLPALKAWCGWVRNGVAGRDSPDA